MNKDVEAAEIAAAAARVSGVAKVKETLIGDDGGDLFYFGHPGHTDGYKSYVVCYPKRGQGLVIMTNSDADDELYYEILYSVNNEYGWVRNYAVLYTIIIIIIIIGVVLFLMLRRRKSSSGLV